MTERHINMVSCIRRLKVQLCYKPGVAVALVLLVLLTYLIVSQGFLESARDDAFDSLVRKETNNNLPKHPRSPNKHAPKDPNLPQRVRNHHKNAEAKGPRPDTKKDNDEGFNGGKEGIEPEKVMNVLKPKQTNAKETLKVGPKGKTGKAAIVKMAKNATVHTKAGKNVKQLGENNKIEKTKDGKGPKGKIAAKGQTDVKNPDKKIKGKGQGIAKNQAIAKDQAHAKDQVIAKDKTIAKGQNVMKVKNLAKGPSIVKGKGAVKKGKTPTNNNGQSGNVKQTR